MLPRQVQLPPQRVQHKIGRILAFDHQRIRSKIQPRPTGRPPQGQRPVVNRFDHGNGQRHIHIPGLRHDPPRLMAGVVPRQINGFGQMHGLDVRHPEEIDNEPHQVRPKLQQQVLRFAQQPDAERSRPQRCQRQTPMHLGHGHASQVPTRQHTLEPVIRRQAHEVVTGMEAHTVFLCDCLDLGGLGR